MIYDVSKTVFTLGELARVVWADVIPDHFTACSSEPRVDPAAEWHWTWAVPLALQSSVTTDCPELGTWQSLGWPTRCWGCRGYCRCKARGPNTEIMGRWRMHFKCQSSAPRWQTGIIWSLNLWRCLQAALLWQQFEKIIHITHSIRLLHTFWKKD